MSETKPKRPAVKRKAKAANSPSPICPSCGQAGCSGNCSRPISLRYAGPTSQMTHHHARVAAEAPKHSWAAAVVAGLAIVVTLSVAYSAVQAGSEMRTSIRDTASEAQVMHQIGQIRAELSSLEQKVDAVLASQQAIADQQ